MSLPWVRLDANIGTHDKVLELHSTADGRTAFALYVCSLGWSGGHGTDGYIPKAAIVGIAPGLRISERHTRQLVDVQLWEYAVGGWQIRNYSTRQELEVITEGKRAAKRAGAAKGNCRRWHGPECGCWKEAVG